MEMVVKRLDLQPTYKYVSLFDKYEYYHDSPVLLTILDADNQMAEDVSLTMDVVPISHDEYQYSIDGGETKKAGFGAVLQLDDHPTFIINRTKSLGAKFYNAHPITINYESSFNRANEIVGNLSVNSISANSKGVVQVSLTSENYVKSREIIDTLIAVYNEDANEDKKQKTRNTEEFILSRISAIYGELETVESKIDNIRRASGVPYASTTSTTASEMYIDKSNK